MRLGDVLRAMGKDGGGSLRKDVREGRDRVMEIPCLPSKRILFSPAQISMKEAWQSWSSPWRSMD